MGLENKKHVIYQQSDMIPNELPARVPRRTKPIRYGIYSHIKGQPKQYPGRGIARSQGTEVGAHARMDEDEQVARTRPLARGGTRGALCSQLRHTEHREAVLLSAQPAGPGRLVRPLLRCRRRRGAACRGRGEAPGLATLLPGGPGRGKHGQAAQARTKPPGPGCLRHTHTQRKGAAGHARKRQSGEGPDTHTAKRTASGPGSGWPLCSPQFPSCNTFGARPQEGQRLAAAGGERTGSGARRRKRRRFAAREDFRRASKSRALSRQFLERRCPESLKRWTRRKLPTVVSH